MASVASRSRKALASRSLPRLYFEGAAIVGVLATTVFLFNPGIDILVSGVFYSGDGFLGAQDLGARSVRLALIWMTNAAVAVCLAGLLVTSLFRRAWLTLRFSQWLFLAVCYAVGPGVVANLIFKDHWGRARPKDIVEFGGEKAFSLPLIPSDQCLSSCSFLSSETSSVFMVLFAAALVAPRLAGLRYLQPPYCAVP